MTVLLIVFGGAAGAVARGLLTTWMKRVFPVAFPAATLFINVAGCFFLGFFTAFLEERSSFLTTGFLGALTTFSTYIYESVVLFHDKAFIKAVIYFIASPLLGMLAVFCGLRIF